MEAEQIVLEAGDHDSSRPSADDSRRVVHELQVHQIELEIQNDTLRSSQVQLEESRENYSSLFEFSPIGYLILDSNLLVTKANVAATELLEAEKKELIGRTLSRFLVVEDTDKFYFHSQTTRTTGRRETCNVRLAMPSGKLLFVQLHSNLLTPTDGGTAIFQIAISDVSAFESAKEELRVAHRALESRVRERTQSLELANNALVASERELRKLSRAVKQSRSTIVITDREGLTEYVNPRYTESPGFLWKR